MNVSEMGMAGGQMGQGGGYYDGDDDNGEGIGVRG